MSASYLHHYSTQGLIKTTFSIYANFWVSLIAIVAIIELPIYILSDVVNLALRLDNLHLAFRQNLQLTLILMRVTAQIVCYLVLVGEISQVCFGDAIFLKRAFSRIRFRGVGRLLGVICLLLILLYLALFVPPLGGLLVGEAVERFFGSLGFSTIGALVGSLSAIPIVFFLLMNILFIPDVVILERCYWRQALERTFQIVNTSFWRTTWRVLLFALIIHLPMLFLYTPVVDAELSGSATSKFLWNVYFDLVQIIWRPAMPIFLTLLYYNLRIERHELTGQVLVQSQAFQAM